MRSRLTLIITIIFIFAADVMASSWDPPDGTDCRWCNTANWWFGLYPDPTEGVIINETEECGVIVDYGCNAECDFLIVAQLGYEAEINIEAGSTLDATSEVILSNYSGWGTMNVNGGTVNIGDYLSIGYYDYQHDGSTGTVNITDGSINVSSYVILGDVAGYGRLTMTGGSLSTPGDLDMLNGQIRLHGGMITCHDIWFLPPYGTFDIAGPGTLVITQNVTNIIGHSIRRLTACGGNGVLDIQVIGGNTVITTDCVCPEADLTGDCEVDLHDFALFANDWLANVE